MKNQDHGSEIAASIENENTQNAREMRADLLAELDQFTGSMEWHRWSPLFRRDLLTDGAYYLAEKAQAYWLMDLIASWQPEISKGLRHEAYAPDGIDFQVWRIVLDGKGGCTVIADDGNGNELARQRVAYTDFPILAFKLFAVRNEQYGMTIMLPSEY